MEPSEAEEALGEVVERTVSSCEEEEGGGERAWYVRLWGRIAAADISNDEHRSAVRYGGFEQSLCWRLNHTKCFDLSSVLISFWSLLSSS